MITINKKVFEVAPEPADYWGWIAEGRYDHEWRVYDQHLKPEHTFVDLGAWVGAHSLYASKTVKKVLAVEPDPVAFDILLKNVTSADEIMCFPFAIGAFGKVKMGSGWLGASTTRTNPSAGSGIGAWAEDQTFDAASLPLAEFLVRTKDPLFIKCDVEGSEEEIFKDLAVFAERKPTLYVELHPFWWRDEAQTWKNFEVLKALYKQPSQVLNNSWVLTNG